MGRQRKVHKREGSECCPRDMSKTTCFPCTPVLLQKPGVACRGSSLQLMQKALTQESENLTLPPAHLSTVDKVIIVSERISPSRLNFIFQTPRARHCSKAFPSTYQVNPHNDCQWQVVLLPYPISHSGCHMAEALHRRWACPLPSGCVRSALGCCVSANVLGSIMNHHPAL